MQHVIDPASCDCKKPENFNTKTDPAIEVCGHVFKVPKVNVTSPQKLVRAVKPEADPIGIHFSLRNKNGEIAIHVNTKEFERRNKPIEVVVS